MVDCLQSPHGLYLLDQDLKSEFRREGITHRMDLGKCCCVSPFIAVLPLTDFPSPKKCTYLRGRNGR